MRIRFALVLSGFALLFVALVVNLYHIQINSGAGYAARAASQIRSSGILKPHRGMISVTDRTGTVPLAMNRTFPTVFAVPNEIADAPEAAQQLAPILGLDSVVLQRQLSQKGKYQPLASQVTESQVQALRELDLVGVYIDSEERRFYPFGQLAAQVLGFVGPSSKDDEMSGRYGIEGMFEKELRGADGAATDRGFTPAADGADVTLTIDRNIQNRAESILAGLVERFDAIGGSVIVQDPKTGRILAMAGAPTFDPNNYGASPVGNFINPTVQGIYEPGSVFKVLTMAAGIDSGAFTPDTTVVDTGSMRIGDKTIRNWDYDTHGAYGTVTMTNVIEKSINIGAAKAGQMVGREKLLDYFTKFGIEEETGIELPGEVTGSLRTLRAKDAPINLATASFGQGVSVTPLRLISAVSALANDGLLMEPQIIAGKAPQEVRRVVSKQTAEKVTAMMVSAVSKGIIGQVSSYTTAGKTGTAQIPGRGGYTGKFIHSFAGYAPSGLTPGSEPRATVFIRLDDPDAPVAGATVVPAFRELMQFILNYYGVAPDALPVPTP